MHDERWTGRLVIFLRVMAVLSMAKGLYHWALVSGVDRARGWLRVPADAVADGDGVFRGDRSGRGGRALARRGLGRGGLAHRLRVDGGGRGVLPAGLWRAADRSSAIEGVLLFTYLALAIQSAREHPN